MGRDGAGWGGMGMGMELLNVENETFQVFTFRVGDVYRVVGRLSELMQNANLAS